MPKTEPKTAPTPTFAEATAALSFADMVDAARSRLVDAKAEQAAEKDRAQQIVGAAEGKLNLAREQIEADRKAAAMLRKTAAMRTAIARLAPLCAEADADDYSLSKVKALQAAFNEEDAAATHVTGEPLRNELGFAVATAFMARHPTAIEILAQHELWTCAYGFSLGTFVHAANVAMRNPLNPSGAQEALIALVAKMGEAAAQTGSRLSPADAPKLWEILSGLPEERRTEALHAFHLGKAA